MNSKQLFVILLVGMPFYALLIVWIMGELQTKKPERCDVVATILDSSGTEIMGFLMPEDGLFLNCGDDVVILDVSTGKTKRHVGMAGKFYKPDAVSEKE